RRSPWRRYPTWPDLHVATVLAADLIERARDLAERGHLDRLDQRLEDVAAPARHLAQVRQRRLAPPRAERLEGPHGGDLVVLLGPGRAHQLLPLGPLFLALLGLEGVDADDRQRAVVLAPLVVHRLFLDAATLVHRVHRAEHPAAL